MGELERGKEGEREEEGGRGGGIGEGPRDDMANSSTILLKSFNCDEKGESKKL